MTFFPAGFTDVPTPDSNDVFLLDGKRKATGAAVKGLALPDGVVDAGDYTAVAATVVEDCEVTTGWTQAGTQDALSASTAHFTQGTKAIRANMRVNESEAVAHLYKTLSPALSPAGRTYLAADVLYAIESGGGLVSAYDYFSLEINDGATFAGNAVQLPIPPISENSFITLLIPVGALAEIESVGIRRTTTVTTTGVRVAWYIDNIRWPTQNEIEAALTANPTGAVVVPPALTVASASNPGTLAPSTVLDLRPTHTYLSRFGGFYHFRDFNIPEDGVTDCSNAIMSAIAQTPDNSTLLSTPGMAYRCDSEIVISEKNAITVDFQGARLFATATRFADAVGMNTPFFTVRDADNITLRNGRIFGYRTSISNGSSLIASNSELLSEAARGVETTGTVWSTGWANLTNCGVVRSDRGSEIVLAGNISLRMDPGVVGDMAMSSPTGTSGLRAKASTSYTFRVTTRPKAGAAARNVRIDAIWYDSAGAVISTSTGTNSSETSDVVAKAHSQAHTSPALTAYVSMVVNVLGTTDVSEYHYADSFSIKLTTAVTAVDVGTTSTLSVQHAELRVPMGNGDADPQYFARDKDGYIKVGFTLSDSNQVANDCEIMGFDNTTGTIIARSTHTLTGTPTLVTLSHFLLPLELRYKIRWIVRKLTATTNTITVTSSTEYGRNTYASNIEEQHGVSCWHRSRHTRILDMEFEGVGGDAVTSTSSTSFDVLVEGGFSRCAMRQGLSFNNIDTVTIRDYLIYQPGRSGLDFEPSASDGYVRHVRVNNVQIFDAYNYDIAAGNWGRNYDFEIDSVVGHESRLGFIFGGFKHGTMRNCKRIPAEANWKISNDMDWTVTGQDMTLYNCVAAGGFMLSGTGTSTYDPGPTSETLTSGGIVGIGLRISSPIGRMVVGANCYAEWTQTQNELTLEYGSYVSPVRADGVIGKWDPGELRRQLSNSFKGVVVGSNPWFPGGLNMLDDPAYRVRALSGSTTRGNNLRGVAAAVTASATTHAVTFPTRTWANPVGEAFTPTTGGSLTPSTTYYYRIASRNRYGGPIVADVQLSAVLNGSQNAVTIRPGITIDMTADIAHTHFTIYRGTTSGGPYTHRIEITPTSDFPGIAYNTLNAWLDIGATITMPAVSNDLYGYASSYTWVAGTYTPIDESGYEPDATYAVMVETNWATQTWITNKATSGFTINCGTAAPGDGSGRVSWLLIR